MQNGKTDLGIPRVQDTSGSSALPLSAIPSNHLPSLWFSTNPQDNSLFGTHSWDPDRWLFFTPPTLYYRCSRITLKSVATWPYELLLPVHLHPLGIDTEIREPLGLPFSGLSNHSFVTLTLYQGPHSCHTWIGPRMGNSNQRMEYLNNKGYTIYLQISTPK